MIKQTSAWQEAIDRLCYSPIPAEQMIRSILSRAVDLPWRVKSPLDPGTESHGILIGPRGSQLPFYDCSTGGLETLVVTGGYFDPELSQILETTVGGLCGTENSRAVLVGMNSLPALLHVVDIARTAVAYPTADSTQKLKAALTILDATLHYEGSDL